jgi:hypothetical protein
MMVFRAGRVIKLAEHLAEGGLVPQRQPKRQVQKIGGGQPANRMQVRSSHRFRHVAVQGLVAGGWRRPHDERAGNSHEQE